MIKMNNAYEQFFNRLQLQIEKAEAENKPIHSLVKQQIKPNVYLRVIKMECY